MKFEKDFKAFLKLELSELDDLLQTTKSGRTNHWKSIAAKLRSILFDSQSIRSGQSLLSRFDTTDLMFWSSAYPVNLTDDSDSESPSYRLTTVVINGAGAASYNAPFDVTLWETSWVGLDRWWSEESVCGSYTRKMVVKALSDKEGPAHYDDDSDPEYILAQTSPNPDIILDGSEMVAPMAMESTVVQIGHELFCSLQGKDIALKTGQRS